MADERPLPAFLAGIQPFSDQDLDNALTPDDAWDASLPHVRTSRERVAPWRPTDDAGAEWAMRKLAETVAAARPIQEQANDWRERIDAWEAAEMAVPTRRIQFFTEMLKTYALEQRSASEDKRKTVRLPSGKIETRGSSDERLVVTDDEAFVASVRMAPFAIRDALTKSKPRSITELRTLLVSYTEVACRECGIMQTILAGTMPADCECGGKQFVLVKEFYGIPGFGLDPEAAGPLVWQVDGVGHEPPPQPTATVSLVDERALKP